MKKLSVIIALFGLFSCFGNDLIAQCGGIRYHNYLFSDSIRSDVKYGLNADYNGMTDTLKLDLHFPMRDTSSANRPLIIWAHAGNFLEGDKADQDVLPLCTAFAEMGYVAASINYRLGMENYPGPNHDSLSSTRAVIRGMQDGRAAVRFFRNSFANGNPYRIDTSHIFFGGVSTGGMVALELAYLNNMNQFPLWCDTTKPGMGGGLAGKSGTAVYSTTSNPVPSNVKAVLSICGAISDTSLILSGSIPVVCFHGDKDTVVSYKRHRLNMNGDTLQTMCGGYLISQRATHVGVMNCFTDYIGKYQMPEIRTDSTGPFFLDTTLNIMRNFLATLVCGDILSCTYQNPLAGIQESNKDHAVLHCFPNPAGSSVNIDLSDFKGEPVEISIVNALGQEVRRYKAVREELFILDRKELHSGLYLIGVESDGRHYQTRVIFE